MRAALKKVDDARKDERLKHLPPGQLPDLDPPTFSVPSEFGWQDFLRFMGWTDFDVLGRQPDLQVYLAWRLFRLRVQFGML